MIKGLLVSLSVLAAGGCTWEEPKPVYPNRWVRIQGSLRDDADLERIIGLVDRAAAHRLNGIALSAGLDTLDQKPPEYFERLARLRQFCESKNVDIIPSFWSAGYGGGILAHDRNLAAGLPVRNVVFQVKNQAANLAPDPDAVLKNGGFEEADGGRPTGFSLAGQPGEVIFIDRQVSHDGNASVRFEHFADFPEENARIRQTVKVTPYRQYRVSGWVKAEGMDADDPFGNSNFMLEVYGVGDNRRLQFENPILAQDTAWHQFFVAFNSWDYEAVEIVPLVTGTKKGQLWLDGLHLEEIGMVNLLRRPGTPLKVVSAKDGTVYQEGVDFAPVADPKLDFRVNREGQAIQLLPGSRIKEGDRLLVSFYHGTTIYKSQTPICMSESKTYEIWQKQADLVWAALRPAKFLINMDEVRVGGSCEACKSRGLTNAQILGDCLTRQYSILKGVNPKAEIYVWSDMLDPNHNANPDRTYYYLAEQNFVDAWKYVPKDLGIVCWYYEVRDLSLAHFSQQGFRTMAGSYYDADDLSNPRDWLASLDATPNACGIMYTTWLNKYALLEEFGDLVSRRR